MQGRPFAWQEVQMCLATLFLRFDFELADPSYELRLKQALAIKPRDFRFYARPRGSEPFRAPASTTVQQTHAAAGNETEDSGGAKQTLYVLYGSNTGSCETFAQRIAGAARGHGFRAAIGTLDSAAGRIPRDGPVVLVTASFEGARPPLLPAVPV